MKRIVFKIGHYYQRTDVKIVPKIYKIIGYKTVKSFGRPYKVVWVKTNKEPLTVRIKCQPEEARRCPFHKIECHKDPYKNCVVMSSSPNWEEVPKLKGILEVGE